MHVTVRYFAGASAAAGCSGEDVDLPDGADVSALVALLTLRHGERLARVLQASTFLVDEVSAPRTAVLRDASNVDVLPPFAGG